VSRRRRKTEEKKNKNRRERRNTRPKRRRIVEKLKMSVPPPRHDSAIPVSVSVPADPIPSLITIPSHPLTHPYPHRNPHLAEIPPLYPAALAGTELSECKLWFTCFQRCHSNFSAL